MKYLLFMSLSGSTMVGVCMLLRFLFRDKMSARLQYLLARAAVLYYLIPLPFVKKLYESIAGYILPEKKVTVSQVSLIWSGYLVRANGKTYINDYLKVQLVVVVLWLLISFLWLIFELNDYLKTRKKILSYADEVIAKEEAVFLERLKKRYDLKRNITVYQGNTGVGTITFGLLQPVILCDQRMGSPAAELILCHELIHIKRWDILWQMLRQLAFLLHWWNPVMWILYRDFERVCEWSCDEATVQGRTKDEKKMYIRLLIMESTKEKYDGHTRLQWGMSFENASVVKKLEKRMENVMKMKNWNKTIAGIVTVTLVLVNSLTVFAYNEAVHEDCEVGVSQEQIDRKLEGNGWQFIPDEINEKELDGFTSYVTESGRIEYDVQFTDEDGNIYRVQEKTSVVAYANCNHTYVSGRVNKHIPKSGGSCVVEEYYAQRCSKCGSVVMGDRINEITFAVCPH
ncbi:MAG: M56 family metallopeptidase [Lachnospiraceae bacterium]|nr:M56 family metallopeptidase [Lachnospiraceae bacterium]